MNDPHVKALHYRLIVNESADFNNAQPLFVDTDEFVLYLNKDGAVFEMKSHFPSAEEAKAETNEFLQAWRIYRELEHDPDTLRFIFDHAEIIDRSPPKSSEKSTSLQVSESEHMHFSERVTLHISYGKFPTPPNNFGISPDVETMFLRYKAYRQNREPLTSMAYMCLTIFETSAGIKGRRQKAAEKYNIDKDILRKLAELCSTKGDRNQARKAPEDGKFTPLSHSEKEWILAVVKAMIRRVGGYVYDPNADFKKLTIADFPDISTENNS